MDDNRSGSWSRYVLAEICPKFLDPLHVDPDCYLNIDSDMYLESITLFFGGNPIHPYGSTSKYLGHARP